MYESVSKRIVDFLIKEDVVNTNKAEIYEFGIASIMSRIVSLILLFSVGFIMNAVMETCVFYITFLLMRKFSGGYHASTYTSCTMLYILTFVITVFNAKLIFPNFVTTPIIITALCFNILTVTVYAPIENPNNPIAIGRRNDYRKFAIVIVIVLSIIDIVLININLNVCYILLVSMLLAVAYMYIEIINRKIRGCKR